MCYLNLSVLKIPLRHDDMSDVDRLILVVPDAREILREISGCESFSFLILFKFGRAEIYFDVLSSLACCRLPRLVSGKSYVRMFDDVLNRRWCLN